MTSTMNASNKVIQVLRILLAVILLVFSSNGFIGFLPMPVPPEPAAEFVKSMSEAGFVFPLLYGIEMVIGIFLLFNRFTPLMILAFAPIALNILLYHLFLDPLGGAAGYLTVGIEIFLLRAYIGHYRLLLKAR